MGEAFESQPTLNDLAAKVTELTSSFSKFLEKNKIPAPTFAADSPTSYTGLDAEAFGLKSQLLDALSDMWILTQGPSESIFNYCHSVSNFLSDADCSYAYGPPIRMFQADNFITARSCPTQLV